MSDEALRMEAEVRDKFSGPLKALRAQLLDTARTGNNHSETLAKGFKTVEGAMQSTARTASSVVNPAFAALGVTGLSAGAAVAGISAALNKLTGNLTGLGQLSRDTGLAAKTLQEFGAVAGRVGIEQDAVAAASKNFAAQMRTFSRGTGEAFNWVMRQGTDAAGRKAFQDFATDLQHTSDEGEKLKKALSFMETIKNPTEKGIFAQQFFGNEDLKRLADGHLGTVVQQFKNARDKIGPFNEKDIIDAEKFDRSVSSLKGSMQRLGTTIARELLGPATELTTWADDLVSGKRADLTKSLREGLQEVKKELVAIDWKQFGEDSLTVLRESTALASKTAAAFHAIAEAVHAIRGGEYAQAARGLDGASGPLARALAPQVGDDEIAAKEEVDLLRKQMDRPMVDFESGASIDTSFLDVARAKQLEEAEAKLKALQARTPEQRQADFARQQAPSAPKATFAPDARPAEIPGRVPALDGAPPPLARRIGDDELAAQETVNRLRRLRDRGSDTPEAAQQKLDAAEGELQRLRDRTPEQRQKDFEASEKLRKSVDALTDEMKASRGGATVSKMSADSQGGVFGEATVQTAAFGGGGFRRPGRLLPPDDPVQREARRQAGEGNAGNPDAGWFGGRPGIDGRSGGGSGPGYSGERGGRSYGAGRFNPLGSRPRIPPVGPRPETPRFVPRAGGRAARAERGGGAARTGEMMAYAMDQLRREGVPEERLREAAAHLVGQATMESGLDPNKTHDPDRNGNPTGYGIYGARLVRRDRMLRWLSENSFSPNSAEGQMRYMAREAMTDRNYSRTRNILMGMGSGNLEYDTDTITKNFESPAIINRRSGAVQEALRVGPSGARVDRADAGDAGNADLLPNGAPRVLKPNSMRDAPGVTMDEASRQREALKGGFVRRAEVLADPSDERRRPEGSFYSEEDDRRAARDLGIALRATRAKQDAQREQMRMDGARVGAAAAQAGVVGSTVNGSVTNIVEKPGPDTKIKTKVDGNLFQEVRTQNGAQMRKAD